MGKAIAKRLHGAGYHVYAATRRIDRMADRARAGAHVLTLDVTLDQSMTEAIGLIDHQSGRIDVLVNASGYGQFGALEDVPMAEARRQRETKLYQGSQAAPFDRNDQDAGGSQSSPSQHPNRMAHRIFTPTAAAEPFEPGGSSASAKPKAIRLLVPPWFRRKPTAPRNLVKVPVTNCTH